MHRGIELAIASHCEARVDESMLSRAIAHTLKHAGVNDAIIDLLLVDDDEMRELNRQHLNHDYITDVLSFHLGEIPGGGICAQLIICPPFAEREAADHDISHDEELVRYAVHGTLHLVGYDDHEIEDRDEMWRVQEALVHEILA